MHDGWHVSKIKDFKLQKSSEEAAHVVDINACSHIGPFAEKADDASYIFKCKLPLRKESELSRSVLTVGFCSFLGQKNFKPKS